MNNKLLKSIRELLEEKKFVDASWIEDYDNRLLVEILVELVDHIDSLEKQLAEKGKPSKKSVLGSEEEQMDMFGE